MERTFTALRLQALVLALLMIPGCFTLTFETAGVQRGFQGSVGAGYAVRCHDYVGIEGARTLDTRAVILSCGVAYGFSEQTALYARASQSFVQAGEGEGFSGADFAVGVKQEGSRPGDAIVGSVSAGLSTAGILEARPMLGFRSGGHEYVTLGSTILLYYCRPQNVFLAVAPFGRAGLAVYLGHSLLWLFDDDRRIRPANVAVGLGMRF